MRLGTVLRKLRTQGAQNVVQSIEWRIHPIATDPDLSARLFDELVHQQEPLTIVQIGPHVGATKNDPLHTFLTTHADRYRAVLVEPVGRSTRSCVEPMRHARGVVCEAIAETSRIRDFYTLADGVPDCADQLGSLPRIDSRCCGGSFRPIRPRPCWRT